MKNILNFIKYHNLFTLMIVVVLVGGGSAFAANPQLREAVEDTLVGKTETLVLIDNTTLLNTDFNTFNPELVIKEVTEDVEAYYILYTFNTYAVTDGAWKRVEKEGTLKVNKDTLNNENLQTYVEEELGEVARAEIAFLKEVKEAEQEKGEVQKTTIIAYTGLLGLVVDPKEKVEEQAENTTQETTTQSIQVHSNGSTAITINGNNPAKIPLRSTYNDLGATYVNIFGETVSVDKFIVNGTSTQNISIDTSIDGTHSVTYMVELNGNTTTKTREVIVGSGEAVQEVTEDTTPPTVTLIGETSIEITEGDTYTDEGATAEDDTDGDITESIITSNTVDTSIPDTYTITYNVQDQAENQADQVSRTVIVLPIVEEAASTTPETS